MLVPETRVAYKIQKAMASKIPWPAYKISFTLANKCSFCLLICNVLGSSLFWSKKLKKVAKQDGVDNEIEYFQKALDMEIKTSNFYKKLVNELPAGEKELFERFIEIEEGHEAIVSAEIDNARGLGYWFDFEEFDLESA